MAVTIQTYNQFLELLGDGTLDMDTHTFKIALMTSGFVFDATDTIWTDVSGSELANGNGYTTGGLALTSVTWSQTSGTVTFDFADPTWTASGAGLSGITDAVIYDDTASGDPLMFALDLGGSFSAIAASQFVIQLPGTGFFTIA